MKKENRSIKTNNIIGDLRYERMMRKMTMAELAQRSGIPYQTISDWEHGRTIPGIDRVITWAEALGFRLELMR